MSWVNFKEEEFSCKHCGKNGISHELINKLQSLRTELDFPFIITSGYRCEDHPIEAKKKTPGTHAFRRKRQHIREVLTRQKDAGAAAIAKSMRPTLWTKDYMIPAHGPQTKTILNS